MLFRSLWFRVILQPITWIFNFMTLLGLLALFHSQGVKQVRKRERRISLTALSPEHITYLEAEPNTISRDIILKVNRSDDMRSRSPEDIDVLEQNISEIYIQSRFQQFLQDSVFENTHQALPVSRSETQE